MTNIPKSLVELLANRTDKEWFDMQLLRVQSGAVSDDTIVPPFPPDSVQLSFNGTSGEVNLRQAFLIYGHIKAQIYKWSGLSPDTRVLDFGCGWGRVARFFLKDVHAGYFHGVDISPSGIDTCRSLLPGRFDRIDRYPPLEYPTNTFGVVYAWSVFSHLPEILHLQWLQEIARILLPGGVFIASTLKRNFLEDCRLIRSSRALKQGWQKAAAESFADYEVALQDYDKGVFLYSPRPEIEYGMAIIPEAYVRRRWSDLFKFCAYIGEPESVGQSLIVVRKPY